MATKKKTKAKAKADPPPRLAPKPKAASFTPTTAGGEGDDAVARHMKQHPQVPEDNPRSAVCAGGVCGVCGKVIR